MFSGGLSWWHWMIILAVFILLFGAKKLPEAARGVGRSLRILKSEVSAMHEDDEGFATIGLHHQRLHDLVLGHAELTSRFGGAPMLDVIVDMLGERNAVLAQEPGRRRFRDARRLLHSGSTLPAPRPPAAPSSLAMAAREASNAASASARRFARRPSARPRRTARPAPAATGGLSEPCAWA